MIYEGNKQIILYGGIGSYVYSDIYEIILEIKCK